MRLLMFADLLHCDLESLLPDNVLFAILARLPTRDRFLAGQVCRRWRIVSRHSSLWHHLKIGKNALTLQAAFVILQFANGIASVDFDGGLNSLSALIESSTAASAFHLCKRLSVDLISPDSPFPYGDVLYQRISSVTEELVRVFPQLQQLCFNILFCLRNGYSFVSKLEPLAPTLTHLELCKGLAPQAGVVTSLVKLVNLKHLTGFSAGKFSTLESEQFVDCVLPRLEVLKMLNVNLLSWCPYLGGISLSLLRELDLHLRNRSNFDQLVVSSESLIALFSACSSLRKLKLDIYSYTDEQLTDEEFAGAILSSSAAFERLELFKVTSSIGTYLGAETVSAIGSVCQQLQSLQLSLLPELTDAMLASLTNSLPNLNFLEVDAKIFNNLACLTNETPVEHDNSRLSLIDPEQLAKNFAVVYRPRRFDSDALRLTLKSFR